MGDFRADGFEFVMLSYEKKWGKDAMNVTKVRYLTQLRVEPTW